MNKLLVCLCFIYCSNIAMAQTDKKVVAIMPFLSAIPENRGHAAQLQSIALQTFTSRSNATFIDRSTDALVLKELDNQIREQSISSKVLVEQGKLSGSNEIIVGTLVSVSVETKEISGLLGGYDKKYLANVSFSLQVLDAATGIMKFTKDFNGNTHVQDNGSKLLGKVGGLLMADTKDEAIRKAINATKQQIADWITEAYPPNIKLVNIETRNKKGLPEVVLVTGFGTEVSVGKKIVIKEVTMIDDGNGGKLERVKKIGELKVTELQGQVTVCKVKEGEDVLEEKMKTPASLRFIVE